MQSSSTARKAPRWVVLLMVLIGLSPLVIGGAMLVRQKRGSRAEIAVLERVPFMITAWERASCEPVAAREGVIIAHLDMQGATIFRTGSVPLAGGSDGQTLDRADAQLPPWPAREEVRAALVGNRTFGHYATPDHLAQITTLAQPRPEGGALYIVAGSRSESAFTHRLVLYDLVVTLVLIAPIVVWRRRRGVETAKP